MALGAPNFFKLPIAHALSVTGGSGEELQIGGSMLCDAGALLGNFGEIAPDCQELWHRMSGVGLRHSGCLARNAVAVPLGVEGRGPNFGSRCRAKKFGTVFWVCGSGSWVFGSAMSGRFPHGILTSAMSASPHRILTAAMNIPHNAHKQPTRMTALKIPKRDVSSKIVQRLFFPWEIISSMI